MLAGLLLIKILFRIRQFLKYFNVVLSSIGPYKASNGMRIRESEKGSVPCNTGRELSENQGRELEVKEKNRKSISNRRV